MWDPRIIESLTNIANKCAKRRYAHKRMGEIYKNRLWWYKLPLAIIGFCLTVCSGVNLWTQNTTMSNVIMSINVPFGVLVTLYNKVFGINSHKSLIENHKETGRAYSRIYYEIKQELIKLEVSLHQSQTFERFESDKFLQIEHLAPSVSDAVFQEYDNIKTKNTYIREIEDNTEEQLKRLNILPITDRL